MYIQVCPERFSTEVTVAESRAVVNGAIKLSIRLKPSHTVDPWRGARQGGVSHIDRNTLSQSPHKPALEDRHVIDRNLPQGARPNQYPRSSHTADIGNDGGVRLWHHSAIRQLRVRLRELTPPCVKLAANYRSSLETKWVHLDLSPPGFARPWDDRCGRVDSHIRQSVAA
jgi:hypothetical protein